MKNSLGPPGEKGFANPAKHTGKRMTVVIFLLGASLIASVFFNNYEMQFQFYLRLQTKNSLYAQAAKGENERENESHSNNKGREGETLLGEGEVPPHTQATREVKERDSQPSAKGDEREHLVFIGDSTMRYSFLEFVDREHYQNKADRLPPVELVHEKYHKSWTSFCRYTTEHFEGQMACDCQRANGIENRYYINPHNGHSYTYIQMYGENQGHGSYNPDAVYNATITLPPEDEKYNPKENENLSDTGQDMDQLILQYVAKLEPKPTAIIMNAGLLSNELISFNMEKIMRAAHNVTGVSG